MERVADLLPFDQLIEYESMISSYMICLIKQLSLLLWAWWMIDNYDGGGGDYVAMQLNR
ncbi:hypothetical protein HanIR_Chr05g0220561 [Helianthus annuus]|nr:hypothetical protein HanIR_Chr05g0220561 [Helianthus annuus]